MGKWVDPRVPVLVEQIGKFKVSIYDMQKYEESLLLYPDDPNKDKLHIPKASKVPQFEKQKPQKRWNWVTPLEQPLKGRTA